MRRRQLSSPSLYRQSRATTGLLTALPLLGLPLLVAAQPKPAAPKPAAAPVEFNRDIRPILSANCFSCHGQDEGKRQAGLRLDVREGALAAHGSGAAVVPGKPGQSTLISRVNATNALQMPPAASGHRLTGEQKTLLTRWVQQGAPYAAHWAFTPVRRPAIPVVPDAALRNPIDAFVQARLAKAGLRPSPEADPATLLRRVSLDLTGLPPTPAETEAFLREVEAEKALSVKPLASSKPRLAGAPRPQRLTPNAQGLRTTGTTAAAPDAYARLVDRLLASPRFGEHWARMWLDLARYADTQGYEKDLPRTIWRYRDWVIDAFNADMPYDQFTAEQLAGDLLPNPTASQLLATAFHRNTMTNTEGGTDPEEFRVSAVKDRVDTTMQVWMGLTMGCAKCHSHKYDPITHQDYYRFYAVLNQTEDANRGNEFPTAVTPTEEQSARLAALDGKLKGLREAFWKPLPELAAQQSAWEGELAARKQWQPLRSESAVAASGATLKHRADGAVVVSGARAERDTYTLTLPLPAEAVTSLRLEALKDPSLPNGGPGREATDQNVVTSELTVERIGPDGARAPVALRNPRADFEQGGWPVAAAIDGKPDQGWAFSPQNAQAHVAIFDLAQPLPASAGKLVVTIRQEYPKLQHGCFRLSVSNAEPKLLKAELQSLSEVAAVPREGRPPAQQKQLDEAFRQTHEPTAAIGRDLTAAETERAALQKEIPTTPILRDLTADKQRVTRLHQRGNFLDPGETLTPALPAAFGPLPAGAPLNRLGLARWLTSRDNPLTARVAVNRVWSRLFGTGLVETEEDFGTQGSMPTHPELLDWLAAAFSGVPSSEFRVPGSTSTKGTAELGTRNSEPNLNWSFKQLLRTIVTSATYRQSGAATTASAKADPNNLLLSRGPRFRLPAEVIRDQALAVSGLLSAKLHGPSVMPPQPEGLWKAVYSSLKWQTSPGEDRYRRSLYTFWRRSSPYPSLTTFDAGSGEFCVIRRIRTNTPLQALVTLNDPVFVEAAGALGKTMLAEPNPAPRARVALGFRRVLARTPADAELTRLVRLYEATLADLRTKPDAAKKLLEAAHTPTTPERDATEQAAYTVVANVLLNLDEALTKP
jgi:mono/diheme cytochrome c family protein